MSDHASPDLYPVILPPFAAGAWAMFLTLYLAGTHRFKGRFLALDLTTRTLSLLARLVGVTVALASVWASHGAWVDGMDLCQRGVHAPIKLRTQHAGWYVGLLANGLAFLSGAFAVFFGRGNLLGPTGNQLTMSAIDARQFDAITPTVGPYQVGTTPRGERVMRTLRPASFSEAYRSNRGAFTRRDQEDEAIAMTARDYGVDDVEAGGVEARVGTTRRGVECILLPEKEAGGAAGHAARGRPRRRTSRRPRTVSVGGMSSRRGSGGHVPRRHRRRGEGARLRARKGGPIRIKATIGTSRSVTNAWAGSATSSDASHPRLDYRTIRTGRTARTGAMTPRRLRAVVNRGVTGG